jgi:hypothetical protein
MPVLSIKEFDEELLRRLKAGAALKGITIQEHLENIVRLSVGTEKRKT